MKNTAKIGLLILLIILASCDKIFIGHKYEKGILPKIPVNLSSFNTEYDDFNSTAPTFGGLIPFCFSTNRNSNVNEFEIIYEPFN